MITELVKLIVFKISPRGGPHRKHRSSIVAWVLKNGRFFIRLLHSNSFVPRSLPSNGSLRHIMKNLQLDSVVSSLNTIRNFHTTPLSPIFKLPVTDKRSRDSAVGIATSYGLDGRGVGVRGPAGSRIFSSPRRSYQLWGPANIPSNGDRRLFPRE
jgi:hypothetical protein